MLCQKCGKNQATTYFQQTINGKTSAVQLCSSCAAEMGIGNMFNHSVMSDMFSEFLTNTFNTPTVSTDKVCKKCSSSITEIMNSGKVGCDECYQVFNQELLPSIENIHSKSTHIGKISVSADSKVKKKAELEQLKSDLNEAVQKQEFENAAKLRDRIKLIEKELEM